MRITTATGKRIKKVNAIMYNEEYYGKKDDCVKIGGRYYPLTHPDIAINFETGEYDFKTKMVEGIISFNGNTPVLGYFKLNRDKHVRCFTDRYTDKYAVNENIIPSLFVENISTGDYYHSPSFSSSEISGIKMIRTVTSHTEKGYNIEDNHSEYARKIESYNRHNSYIPKKIRRYSKLLGDITFGIENEVSQGTVPDRIQSNLGLVLCRDGSVEAGEYVSIPMTGAKGVNNIKLIGQEMGKRCNHDINCSYHVHIGNIDISRSSLLAYYKLFEKIQDELFTMLPYYKTFWRNIKRKDYNKKLTTLFPAYSPNERITNFKDYVDYNYAVLYRSLTGEGILPSSKWNRKAKKHPRGESKWNIGTRYAALNFINAIFSNRNTLEFRSHQDTVNPTKMVSWLFICAAIVKYAEKYKGSILLKDEPITLKQVMDIYKDLNPKNRDAEFLSNYLNAYIEDRKQWYYDLLLDNDTRAEADRATDKDYTFYFENKSII